MGGVTAGTSDPNRPKAYPSPYDAVVLSKKPGRGVVWCGLPLVGALLGIGRLVVSNCFLLHHLVFLAFIVPSLSCLFFVFFFFF